MKCYNIYLAALIVFATTPIVLKKENIELRGPGSVQSPILLLDYDLQLRFRI